MKVARLIRIFGIVLCVVALLVLAVFALAWNRVQQSLPSLDGEASLTQLSAPTSLKRDDQGTAVIEADNHLDAQRALGFAHAQDRFFQMDTLRRSSAGELSALFGERALPLDRANVVHRFRTLSQEVLAQAPANERAVLTAYAEGVNAGLASLAAAPWEYALLGDEPTPWLPEDSVLVLYAMLLDLQNANGRYEVDLTYLRDVLGGRAADYFNPVIGPDDSALDGSTAPLVAPPSERLIDLRTAGQPAEPEEETAGLSPLPERLPIGSNAFAVPGSRTAHGAGLLAGDPHLSLRLPNAWYRAQLNWTDPTGAAHTVTGASLPGAPGIIIGSNGHIAWSFTNALVDCSDLVAVDLNQVAPELLYYYGGDSIEFEHRTDNIVVKDEDDDVVESTWTRYGPIVHRDQRGKPLALKWVFHDPAAVNFRILDLNTARTVEEAVTIAHESGMPHQNMMVVDTAGNAAWTLTGRLPRRFGYDGRFPVSWTFGDRGWDGYVAPADVPVVLAGPGDLLWSGNQRQVGGDALAIVGDNGYDDPERAAQIERRLRELDGQVTEKDLAAIQLDYEADWMKPWRDLLVLTLTRNAEGQSPERAEFQRLIAAWDGRAAADSNGYALLRRWRDHTTRLTMDPIFALCERIKPDFAYWRFRYEAALRDLHTSEPAHLLHGDYASWDALRLAAVDRVITDLDDEGMDLDEVRWGEDNMLEMHHPIAGALPGPTRQWFNMPPLLQSGDSRLPMVSRPRHGASLRLVVAPGQEEEGTLHLPGGQSGNPLSLFYRAGHQAWSQGEPVPLLPGETVHTLTLKP
jgi:penicillin amidase